MDGMNLSVSVSSGSSSFWSPLPARGDLQRWTIKCKDTDAMLSNGTPSHDEWDGKREIQQHCLAACLTVYPID